MKFTEEQKDEFEKLTTQVMKFLCENCHPHVVVVIEPTQAELLEGKLSIVTAEYVRD